MFDKLWFKVCSEKTGSKTYGCPKSTPKSRVQNILPRHNKPDNSKQTFFNIFIKHTKYSKGYVFTIK